MLIVRFHIIRSQQLPKTPEKGRTLLYYCNCKYSCLQIDAQLFHSVQKDTEPKLPTLPNAVPAACSVGAKFPKWGEVRSVIRCKTNAKSVCETQQSSVAAPTKGKDLKSCFLKHYNHVIRKILITKKFYIFVNLPSYENKLLIELTILCLCPEHIMSYIGCHSSCWEFLPYNFGAQLTTSHMWIQSWFITNLRDQFSHLSGCEKWW